MCELNDIKSCKHIVLCVDRYNPLGVIRSLGEGGIRPIVVCIKDGGIPLACKSKWISVLHVVDDDTCAIELLLQLGKKANKKSFLYTCDDRRAVLVDRNYDALSQYFYCFHCDKQGDLEYWVNKDHICTLASSISTINGGWQVPKWEVVKRGELPKEVHYPLITKDIASTLGAWKDDVFVCNNEQELLQAYQKIKGETLMLQEYIKKKNEVSWDGISIEGGKEIYFPFEVAFHRFTKSSYGYYMYVQPMPIGMIESCKKIIRECHYTGCFDIEAIIDEQNQYWFLEINFRFSCWNYAVTKGGVNYPITWALNTLRMENGELTCFPIVNQSILPKTGMVEINDFVAQVVSRRSDDLLMGGGVVSAW